MQRLVALERGIWRSLLRAARRRPAVPSGGQPFGYVRVVALTMWTFVALSALEIPLFHLVIPWPVARISLVLIGTWGLLWAVGYAAGMYQYPHLVTAQQLRLRNGPTFEVVLPWVQVAKIGRDLRSTPTGRTIQFEQTADGLRLLMVMSNQTNIVMTFTAPQLIPTPRGRFELVGVRCWVDDPEAFLTVANAHLQH